MTAGLREQALLGEIMSLEKAEPTSEALQFQTALHQAYHVREPDPRAGSSSWEFVPLSCLKLIQKH